MLRNSLALTLVFLMFFQGIGSALFSSPRDHLADLEHTLMHWQQEGHHHHDHDHYHVDDSEESTRHLLADQAQPSTVLPVTPLRLLASSAETPVVFAVSASPHPFIEEPLRPPRPAA